MASISTPSRRQAAPSARRWGGNRRRRSRRRSRPRWRRNSPCRIREHHRAVAYRTVAQVEEIERVILVQLPRPLRSLFGEFMRRALDVAGGEIDQRSALHRGIVDARGALAIALARHVIEQAADI